AAKTAAVRQLSAELSMPWVQLVGYESATEAEIFGKWIVKDGKPEFQPGPFFLMFNSGGDIFVDEINQYPKRIQELIGEFARAYRQNKPVAIEIGGRPVLVERSPHTRLVAAGNPDFKGVKDLCTALNEGFEVQFAKAIPPDELTVIASTLYPDVPQEMI